MITGYQKSRYKQWAIFIVIQRGNLAPLCEPPEVNPNYANWARGHSHKVCSTKQVNSFENTSENTHPTYNVGVFGKELIIKMLGSWKPRALWGCIRRDNKWKEAIKSLIFMLTSANMKIKLKPSAAPPPLSPLFHLRVRLCISGRQPASRKERN